MDFTEFDIEFLAQKLAENPQSPIFARLADLYLETEKTAEAIQLCEEGIKIFPDYYAGHLVLGKAYLLFKEYSKARASFERTLELCPFNHHAEKLLLDVPDGPDESTRVTDSTYFSEMPKQESNELPADIFSQSDYSGELTGSSENLDQPLPSLFDMVEPVSEEKTPDQILEEYTSSQDSFNQYTQQPQIQEATSSIEDAFSAIGNSYQQTEYSPTVSQQSSFVEPSPPEALKNFEDYFNQKQNEILSLPTISLDDYLRNKIPAEIELLVAQEVHQRPVMQKELSTEQSQFIDTLVESELSGETPQQIDQPFVEPYFEQPLEPYNEPIQTPSTDFDVLTEKLQNAERIKPQENYVPQQQITPQDEQTAYQSDMVTPTLAEIYASQGEYGAAIQAYEILQFSIPEQSASFQQRISELQKKQMEKDGLM